MRLGRKKLRFRSELLEARYLLTAVAVDDLAAVDEDQAVMANVLGNDSETGGLALIVETTPVSPPNHGQLTLNSNGNFTYSPSPDYWGSDSFEYRVGNGVPGESDVGLVTITVNPINDPPEPQNVTVEVLEDSQAVRIPVVTDEVRGTDSDLDPVELVTITSVGPMNGTVTFDKFVVFYTPPANFFGQDSFTFTLTDSSGTEMTPGLSGAAVVTVNVQNVNDPPVAQDDSFSGTSSGGISANLIANDQDIDGDTLTIETSAVSGPSKGSLVLNANGDFTYTPDPGTNGGDSFVYRVKDGSLTDTATVTLSINATPVARDDGFQVNENQTLNGSVLVDNGNGVDSDLEGDTLSVDTSPVDPPDHGQLTLNANGSFTYQPNPDFDGDDSFVYRLSDGQSSSTATVSITVANVNRSPSAKDDSIAGQEDQTVNGNVLADNGNGVDVDPDGDTLTVSLLDGPADGSLTLNDDGSFTYQPAANVHGTRTFSYQVSDGQQGTDTATATIQLAAVNDLPVARDDGFQVNENQTLNGSVLVDNGNGVDSDLEGDTLSVDTSPVDPPDHGQLTLNANGSFTYQPNPDFDGDDSFVYRLSDGQSSSTATVSITVANVNRSPSAKDDSIAGQEDQTVNGNVLADNGNGVDVDPDGDTLTVSLLDGPADGSLTLNDDGSFTYQPAANVHGTRTFSYQVSDGQQGTDTATATIRLAAVNDLPKAEDDSFSVAQGVELAGNVLVDNGEGVDSDVEDETLSVDQEPVDGPHHGTLSLNEDGSFVYRSEADFVGTDTFQYRAKDADGGSSTATVTITVTEIPNEAPVAKDDTFSIAEDMQLAGNVLADNGGGEDIDGDGDSLSVEPAEGSGPTHGSLSLNGDGSFTYLPHDNFFGDDSFEYRISDGKVTDTGQVSLTVTPVNDVPVALPDTFTTPANTKLIGNLLEDNGEGPDQDPDQTGLTVQLTENVPQSGLLVLKQDGDFEYTPNLGFSGSDQFDYSLVDGDGDVQTATVVITVEPTGVASPQVTALEKNGGADLHDRIQQVRISFSTSVADSLDASDLLLFASDGSQIDTSTVTVTWDEGAASAIWDLSKLPLSVDRYTVRLASESLTDVLGQPLDGNGDGEAGGDYAADILLTFGGDVDFNFEVNFDDFLKLAANFGQPGTWLEGDSDADGQITFDDFLTLAANFGLKKELPQAAVAAALAAESHWL